MDIESKLQITEPLAAGDVAELVGLFKTYPFWHVPMAVLARHFRLQDSEKLDVASAMAAMRIPSQSELYNYVYNEVKKSKNQDNDIVHAKDNVPSDLRDSETAANLLDGEFNKERISNTEKSASGEPIETNESILEGHEVPADEEDLIDEIEEIVDASNEIKVVPVQEMGKNSEDVTAKETKIEERHGDIEEPTYQEIQPFVAKIPEIEEPMTVVETFTEIKTDAMAQTIMANKVTELSKEVKYTPESIDDEKSQSIERTLEEIESLMKEKSSFSIIPEKTESRPLSESMQTSDELLSSYSITDHFVLPASEKVSDSQDFYYWLTQGKGNNTPITKPKNKVEKQEKPVKKKLNKSEILDEFIKRNPSIGPIKPTDSKDLTDYSKKADEMPLELATETLARIYIQQGNNSAAKKIYKLLILKFPSKKRYFASQIDELKNKK